MLLQFRGDLLMLLQIQYLLLKVLGSVRILEQGGQGGRILRDCWLLLLEKRGETGIHIVEVIANWPML